MSYEGFLNMKLNLPKYDLPENYWGTCFQQLTPYTYKKKRKKYLRSSQVGGKREVACFYVETATGNRPPFFFPPFFAFAKREKWRGKRGHVVIFGFYWNIHVLLEIVATLFCFQAVNRVKRDWIIGRKFENIVTILFFYQVGRIVDVLKDRSSHHNGFPVVDCHGASSDEVKSFFLLCLAFLKAETLFSKNSISQSGTGFMFVTSSNWFITFFKLVAIDQTDLLKEWWRINAAAC